VENCALCHGAAGEGIGTVPALDIEALREADYDTLTKTISRGIYGTTMAPWHVDEGGIFNDYQVDELVALIRYVDWPLVGELAARQGLIPPTLPVPEVDEVFLEEVVALDPQGSVWAEGMQIYANNCTVCHGINGEGSDIGVSLNNTDVRELGTAELVRIISEGAPNTLMTGWAGVLELAEIEALAEFLGHWDVIEGSDLALELPEPVHVDLDNPEEVMALGERLFNTTCAVCHGDNGTGGTGPALNSLQVLTNNTDAQIESTIIQGGTRPNSSMPSFGDRLTSVEISALVDFIRAWEPTATWVENPRGTLQGGGPPWLRTATDGTDPVDPGTGAQGGGPPWRQDSSTSPADQASSSPDAASQGPAIAIAGTVVSSEGNVLTLQSSDGSQVTANLGPPWFWSENGIPLNPGDLIEMEAFESTDHMEVNWLNNLTTGESIELRTADGLPVWTTGE
jgi:mono/diheme cytochrome c family protein